MVCVDEESCANCFRKAGNQIGTAFWENILQVSVEDNVIMIYVNTGHLGTRS